MIKYILDICIHPIRKQWLLQLDGPAHWRHHIQRYHRRVRPARPATHTYANRITIHRHRSPLEPDQRQRQKQPGLVAKPAGGRRRTGRLARALGRSTGHRLHPAGHLDAAALRGANAQLLRVRAGVPAAARLRCAQPGGAQSDAVLRAFHCAAHDRRRQVHLAVSEAARRRLLCAWTVAVVGDRPRCSCRQNDAARCGRTGRRCRTAGI